MINCYKKLWAAVLDRAIEDSAYEEDARAWFQSGREGIGSFLWICDTLELDPDSLKRRLDYKWSTADVWLEEDLIEKRQAFFGR